MQLERRHFLGKAGLGFGSLALHSMLQSEGLGATGLGGIDGKRLRLGSALICVVFAGGRDYRPGCCKTNLGEGTCH